MQIKFKDYLTDKNKNTVDDIIKIIDSNKSKKSIKREMLYNDGIDTAISNSKISYFYKNYYRTIYNVRKVNIPFPKEKVTKEVSDVLDKLNSLSIIFDNAGKTYNDNYYKLSHLICLQLMDVILFDLYFDIKPIYDLYEEINIINIPDDRKENISAAALPLIKRDGRIENILFSILSENIVNFVINFDFNPYRKIK